jgi:hypothetical protein
MILEWWNISFYSLCFLDISGQCLSCEDKATPVVGICTATSLYQRGRIPGGPSCDSPLCVRVREDMEFTWDQVRISWITL